MARNMVSTHTGLPFTQTDGGGRYMVGKSACHDSIAWTDLDGDGCIDFVAIATESGNYEDTDHELVAVHVPTGSVGWRALPGEVSKRVSFVGGVIVASTRSASRLVGVDPRSGQKLWDVALADVLEEDNFDDDRARALEPLGGTLFAVQCKDDSYHLIDAATGKTVKSGEGKWKSMGGGVPGIVGIAFEDDDRLEVWDIPKNKKIADLKDTSQARVVPGPGYFALLRHGEMDSNGAWGYEARVFDGASSNELGKVRLVGNDDQIHIGDGEARVIGGMILPGNRLIFGARYNPPALVVDLVPGGKSKVRDFPPPKPGYKFRSIAYVAPALVTVWEKEKGTSKFMVVGHDPTSLAPVWTAEDLGGRDLALPLHVTDQAVLVPRNPGSNQNEYAKNLNECSIQHLDPQTGAVVTEYPVEDVDCVELHGYFLVGAPTYFSGGVPTVYDTYNRRRVL